MTEPHPPDLDVHILSLPGRPRPWLDRCLASLPEGVNVYLDDGIDGDVATARLRSYRRGNAPFACYVDDDDEVVAEGVLTALSTIQADPGIAGICTWRSILYDNGHRTDFRPATWDARTHYFTPSLFHQVCIMRRELLMPIAEEMAHERLAFDIVVKLTYAARHGLAVCPKLGYLKHARAESLIGTRRPEIMKAYQRHMRLCRPLMVS